VPPELAGHLGWLLARAAQQVGGALSGGLAGVGLTPRELSVLLAAAPQPRPQLGLAVAIGLDKTTMVATVDALERRGLARRESDPHDRRLRLVAVTAKGRELADRAAAVVAGVERQIVAELPDGEQLLPLLRALVAAQAGARPGGSCV
jgi:DNA-binding MarR family transcriptional regulator